MSTITPSTSAHPRAILKGLEDLSGGKLPVEQEEIPTFLAHVWTYAERGPLVPQLVVGGSRINTYGAKTFDYRGPYATHQTVLANTLNANGNSVMLHRLVAPGAKTSTLLVSLEVLRTEIPQYERNATGGFKLDANEERIPTGTTLPGHQLRWIVTEAPDGDIRAGVSVAGALTDGTNQSEIYPWFGLEVSHIGAYGDNVGFRLAAPTTASTIPTNQGVVMDNAAYLYRLQCVERPDAKSSPNVIKTRFGATSIDFMFKQDTLNRATTAILDIEKQAISQWTDKDTAPVTYGPFGDFHLYRENVESVLAMLYAEEVQQQPAWPQTGGEHLVNVVSATNVDGDPLYTVDVLGSADSGIEFNESTTFYARGGSDGNMSLEDFSSQVGNQCANYGDLPGLEFLDSAEYPQSIIIDTGFPVDVKKQMLTPISRRKDIFVMLATQDISQPQNSVVDESSMARALHAAASMYPESAFFGTPVVRAAIVGHSSWLKNSEYEGLLPFTIDLADKMSKFMGAGNGVWKKDRGFDEAPLNQVTMFDTKRMNGAWKPSTVYMNDWTNGLVWVQRFNRSKLFYPAIQTVYTDSTSVVNSLINTMIIVELEKVAERAWRLLTGGAKLTPEQFLEKSDTLIKEMCEGRFDDRVIIQPRTYFTDEDAALGYAWSTDIEAGFSNMPSVGSYKIVSKRRAQMA